MTPSYTVSRLLSGHETAPSCLALRPLGESYQSAPFHACSKALRQHRFTPSSQAFGHETAPFHASLSNRQGSPSFIAARSPSLEPQGSYLSFTLAHTHTSCLGHKPVGRLSVIPFYAQSYLVSIFSFICLSIFGLIPRLAIALQRYLEVSCPQDRAKMLFIVYVLYCLYTVICTLVLVCLLLRIEICI